MKKCPFCAEKIQDEAIVCRFCGRELAPDAVAKTNQSVGAQASQTEKVSPFIEAETYPSPASDARQITAEAPATEVPVLESSLDQTTVEQNAQKSIWPYSIGGGLVLAILAAIPRLGNLLEVEEAVRLGLLGALALRLASQDLLGHFIANWIGWSLITAVAIAVWRRSRVWAVAAVILIVGGLAALAYWPEIASLVSASQDSDLGQENITVEMLPTSTQPSPTRTLSEQESFLVYDEQLGEWLGLIGSDLTDVGAGNANPLAVKLHINEVRVEMRQFTLPSPSLSTYHEAFLDAVRMISRAITPIAYFDPPDQTEYAVRLQEALEFLDGVIADYADYGTSLGLDVWTQVCESAPDHYRCN